MTTRLCLLSLAGLFLVCKAPGHEPSDHAKPNHSNRQYNYYGAIVAVSTDPNVIPLSSELIQMGLGKIFHPSSGKSAVSFSALPNGNSASQTGVLQLHLEDSDIKLGRISEIDALMRHYEQGLFEATHQYKHRLELRRQHQDQLMRQLQDEVNKIQIEMVFVRQELGKKENDEKQRLEMTSKKRELELEIAGLTARKRMLEERIAETAKTLDRKPAKDSVLLELQEAFRVQRKQLETARLLAKNNSLPAGELERQEDALRNIEIKIAAAEENARQQQLANLHRRIDPLNLELSTTLSDLADGMARLQTVDNFLSAFLKDQKPSMRDLILEMSQREMLLSRAKQRYDAALANLTEIDRLKNEVKDPSVMVINYLDVVPEEEKNNKEKKELPKEGKPNIPASKTDE